MERIYKNKRLIAKIALISLVLSLLLVINVRNDSGPNTSNILAQISPSVEFESRILSVYDFAKSITGTSQITLLSAIGWHTAAPFGILLLLLFLISIYRNRELSNPRSTLVFLCVRIDE